MEDYVWGVEKDLADMYTGLTETECYDSCMEQAKMMFADGATDDMCCGMASYYYSEYDAWAQDCGLAKTGKTYSMDGFWNDEEQYWMDVASFIIPADVYGIPAADLTAGDYTEGDWEYTDEEWMYDDYNWEDEYNWEDDYEWDDYYGEEWDDYYYDDYYYDDYYYGDWEDDYYYGDWEDEYYGDYNDEGSFIDQAEAWIEDTFAEGASKMAVTATTLAAIGLLNM